MVIEILDKPRERSIIDEARELFDGEPPWSVEAHDARGDYVKIALVRRDPSFECGYYVIADDDMEIRREQAIADFRRFVKCRALLSALCNELDQQISLNKTQAQSIACLHERERILHTRLEGAAESLHAMANQLDAWAQQSVEGGWSTHQVNPMRSKAAVVRRAADLLRSSLTPKGEQQQSR